MLKAKLPIILAFMFLNVSCSKQYVVFRVVDAESGLRLGSAYADVTEHPQGTFSSHIKSFVVPGDLYGDVKVFLHPKLYQDFHLKAPGYEGHSFTHPPNNLHTLVGPEDIVLNPGSFIVVPMYRSITVRQAIPKQ